MYDQGEFLYNRITKSNCSATKFDIAFPSKFFVHMTLYNIQYYSPTYHYNS